MPGGDNGAAAVGVVVVRNETPLFSDVLAQALKADRRLASAGLARRTAGCSSRMPPIPSRRGGGGGDAGADRRAQ